jgi:ADP-ribose pyrophosphatase YjhB (NUDIX family)
MVFARHRALISFKTPNGQFNYRVGAVVIDDGYLLACREVDRDYWFLPGGRCELMESSHDAVLRELREEFGVDGMAERLLWIIENFFELGGQSFHEIGLYFLVSLPPRTAIGDKSGVYSFREAATDLEARWIPLAAVTEWKLLPEVLRAEILELPAVTRHIINREIR